MGRQTGNKTKLVVAAGITGHLNTWQRCALGAYICLMIKANALTYITVIAFVVIQNVAHEKNNKYVTQNKRDRCGVKKSKRISI